jgi:hypothetical protein
MTKIICLSRSYLANLIPALAARDPGATYHHIVQTDAEERLVRSKGGEVVLNLQRVVNDGLRRADAPRWSEPEDLRAVTGFPWSPVALDRHLKSFPDERRRIIAGIVYAAVAELLERERYDAFLSEPVAHFLIHVMLYLCRKHGCRPLLWANTYFPGWFYFTPGFDLTRGARSTPLDVEEEAALRETVERYVEGVRADRAGPVYHFRFANIGRSQLSYFKGRRGELPFLFNPGLVSSGIQLARLGLATWKRATFGLHGDYIRAGAVPEHVLYTRSMLATRRGYDSMPDELSRRNVVYPLQYEPEASLTYFTPHVVDQPSFVETVLRALPGDRILYVKEHPNQFGALRTGRWPEIRARYSNVRYIWGRENGRGLIARSSLCVTIASTMGLDAILMGRRSLIAGNVFFGGFSGATRITSYEHLASLLNDETCYDIGDTAAANVEEMVAFGRGCYRGDPQPAATLFSEENLSRLVAGIVDARGG